MWFRFERVRTDDTTKVWCSRSPAYGQMHQVALKDAVADTVTNPPKYYCIPCARECGYVESGQ